MHDSSWDVKAEIHASGNFLSFTDEETETQRGCYVLPGVTRSLGLHSSLFHLSNLTHILPGRTGVISYEDLVMHTQTNIQMSALTFFFKSFKYSIIAIENNPSDSKLGNVLQLYSLSQVTRTYFHFTAN